MDAKFTEDSWDEKTMVEITAKKPGATLVIAAKNDGETEEDLEYLAVVVFVQDVLPADDSE